MIKKREKATSVETYGKKHNIVFVRDFYGQRNISN